MHRPVFISGPQSPIRFVVRRRAVRHLPCRPSQDTPESRSTAVLGTLASLARLSIGAFLRPPHQIGLVALLRFAVSGPQLNLAAPPEGHERIVRGVA